MAKFVELDRGKLEFWFFDYGEFTAYSVIDYPDEIAAATAQLSTNAAGFARVTIRPRLCAEEIRTRPSQRCRPFAFRNNNRPQRVTTCLLRLGSPRRSLVLLFHIQSIIAKAKRGVDLKFAIEVSPEEVRNEATILTKVDDREVRFKLRRQIEAGTRIRIPGEGQS